MKHLTRYCETIKQAEAIEDKLYDQYQTVSLIGWPLFSQDGIYVWAVDGKIR